MKPKHKCKYCEKMLAVEGGMCSNCKKKLPLVRKLLRMVKDEADRTRVNGRDGY